MYNIAVCDDEISIVNLINDILKDKFSALNIPLKLIKLTDPEKLLEMLQNQDIDALFLDIDMPKISGMDIGEFLLNKEGKSPLLIYVTNYDALVYKSFKYHPFGFIRKSHLNDEISEVIKSLYKEFNSIHNDFIIKDNNEYIRLNTSDILYFEAQSNYINVYTKNSKYRFRETMSNLEKKLSEKGFIRVHKGYLVSQNAIFLMKSKEIQLKNKVSIPLGRSYSECAKKTFMKYMRL